MSSAWRHLSKKCAYNAPPQLFCIGFHSPLLGGAGVNLDFWHKMKVDLRVTPAPPPYND